MEPGMHGFMSVHPFDQAVFPDPQGFGHHPGRPLSLQTAFEKLPAQGVAVFFSFCDPASPSVPLPGSDQ
jgi:hypothetical protein